MTDRRPNNRAVPACVLLAARVGVEAALGRVRLGVAAGLHVNR